MKKTSMWSIWKSVGNVVPCAHSRTFIFPKTLRIEDQSNVV